MLYFNVFLSSTVFLFGFACYKKKKINEQYHTHPHEYEQLFRSIAKYKRYKMECEEIRTVK